MNYKLSKVNITNPYFMTRKSSVGQHLFLFCFVFFVFFFDLFCFVFLFFCCFFVVVFFSNPFELRDCVLVSICMHM